MLHVSFLVVRTNLIFDIYFILMCSLTVTGGSGVLSYELKRQYPDMKVYLNDQDHVIKIAKEHFYEGNEHLNINFLPGKSLFCFYCISMTLKPR